MTPHRKYAAGLDDAQKHSIITKQNLRSNMLGLWIKNSMTTNSKCKLRAFNYAFTLNAQDDGATMFFVIVKWCNLIQAQDYQTSILI